MPSRTLAMVAIDWHATTCTEYGMGLKRYTQLPVLLDMLENRRLTVLDPCTWADRNDTYFLEQYALHKEIPGVLALCLTDASATYHHWHVYAGNGPSGVRIEFRRKAFEEWVTNNQNGGELRQVDYFKLREQKSIKIPDDLPFAKRHAFRDEGEWRLIVHKQDASERVRHLEGMPLSLIKGVILSPWLAPPLAGAVISAILHAAGDAQFPVRATTMLANEKFMGIANADEAP